MHPARLFHPAHRRLRQFVTGVALLAYLLTIGGIPLPQAGTQDASVPFPCQHHHCGCQSAEQCWRSCCCYTPQERIAWARANHVAIPDEALAALDGERHQSHHDDAHDDDHDSHGQRACCRSHGHDHHGDAASESCLACQRSSSRALVNWTFGVQARKCQGLSTIWVVSGAAVPLTIPRLWDFDWARVGQTAAPSDSFESLAWAPSIPPPRA